jgi:hypothetical protein
MRTSIIVLTAAIAALAASAEPSHAQNRRFCTQHSIGHGGFPYCGFDTFEQCRATASGTGAYCISNPWHAEPEKPAKRTKKRRS